MVAKIQTKNNTQEWDALWMGIRKADKRSLSRLYKASYTWLFNYGLNIVPQTGVVKDAIQELFFVLWKNKKTISEARSVKSYLRSSLRRIIFLSIQKKKNRTERNRRYQQNLFKKTVNVEELIIRFETNVEREKRFNNAISALSKRQKQAIYLKFYDGLSNDEIAYIMDINKQSVYNHVSEAISSMQAYVQV